jgi:Ca2+-binding EF-hand superfamily protein
VDANRLLARVHPFSACMYADTRKHSDMAFSQGMVENFKEAFSLFDKKGQGINPCDLN